VGSLLKNDLLQEAMHVGTTCLHSNVSLSAQALFRRLSFSVEGEEEVQRLCIRLTIVAHSVRSSLVNNLHT
jgi:hypothetical protein